MPSLTASVDDLVTHSVESLDFEGVSRTYWAQNEAVFIEHLLPPALVEQFIREVDQVRPLVTRRCIPGHKKAGAASFHALLTMAPTIAALYESPVLLSFLRRLVKVPIMRCPEEDLHSCTLYVYTEPGDHIGWHYDTSYYKGERYTVLVGLIERSDRCRLMAELYKDQPGREPKKIRINMDPGSMVIFNSDKLWHAVTPLEEGAERVMLALQFVTDQNMTPFKRIVSNLKDAFVYYGYSALRRRKLS